ncbi:ankyrin repeat domain-containing protein [Kiloniella sp. b19]|uniref:ankyrin repeat domain-containing protein n=1 Tax=Kiloniella sp. GXU_MW_B19 TaxID=3141326 RepID=UPI0031D70D6C
MLRGLIVVSGLVFILLNGLQPAQAQHQTFLEEVANGQAETVLNRIAKDMLLLEARDAEGNTPLLIAARNGHVSLVRDLLAIGADVNALNNKARDILNIATTTRTPELARIALAAGADPTMVTSVYRGSALIYSSARGQVEIVRMLIEAGAPLNRINAIGWTALLEAVILGDGSQPYVEIVSLLLDAGADRDQADRDGLTPLDHARQKGYGALVRLLVRQGE